MYKCEVCKFVDVYVNVNDEWIQWMLGVCKDMNGECVWRMLGESRCDRLPKNCFVTSSMQIMTIYNMSISLFEINCQTYIMDVCVKNMYP